MYRYIVSSLIKSTTRSKRTSKKKPIRKIIGDADTPLPQVWSNFINHEDNKADLARFLSERLIEHRSFLPCTKLWGSYRRWFLRWNCCQVIYQYRRNTSASWKPWGGWLSSDLTCPGCSEKVPVQKSGSLFAEIPMSSCYSCTFLASKTWKYGWLVKQKRKWFLIGFHALTGCDTVSSFSGLGKKTCWKVFGKYPNLLNGVGRDGGLEDEEEFVCRLYKSEVVDSGVNKARACIFDQGKVALEMLPPTQDALELHLSYANYQANAVAPSWLRWKWMWILLQVCWGGKDPQKAFKSFKLCGIDLKVSPLSVLNW